MSKKWRSWRLAQMKQSDGLEPDAVDKSGGKSWKVWHIERNDDVGVLYAVVKAGTRGGAHHHPDANHYAAVIEGKAVVWIDGKVIELLPGDILNIPVGTLHDWAAPHDTDCWVVDLTNPPYDPARQTYHPDIDDEITKALGGIPVPNK